MCNCGEAPWTPSFYCSEKVNKIDQRSFDGIPDLSICRNNIREDWINWPYFCASFAEWASPIFLIFNVRREEDPLPRQMMTTVATSGSDIFHGLTDASCRIIFQFVVFRNWRSIVPAESRDNADQSFLSNASGYVSCIDQNGWSPNNTNNEKC
jgi:hypothetical protein